jgi:hypothetical protein
MKKYLMTVGAVVVLAVATLAADLPKVPQDVAVQIVTAQRDQARVIAASVQANQQYQDAQKTLQKQYDDATAKLAALTQKALADAKLDPSAYELDLEKLEFVAKKPAPAPALAAPEKK